MIMAKKEYDYPIKKKIPLILLLNLFGSYIISQFSAFVKIFCEKLSNYLPGGMKKPRQIVKPSATLFSKNHLETKNQGIYEDDC